MSSIEEEPRRLRLTISSGVTTIGWQVLFASVRNVDADILQSEGITIATNTI